jgi:hypothetical protein
MGRIYEVGRWDGFRCHYIHTEFYKDWFRHSKVNGRGRSSQTYRQQCDLISWLSFFKINKLKDVGFEVLTPVVMKSFAFWDNGRHTAGPAEVIKGPWWLFTAVDPLKLILKSQLTSQIQKSSALKSVSVIVFSLIYKVLYGWSLWWNRLYQCKVKSGVMTGEMLRALAAQLSLQTACIIQPILFIAYSWYLSIQPLA